jgi:hypothetical protein
MGKKGMLAGLGWVVLNKTDHLKELDLGLGWIHLAQGTNK